MGLKSIIIPSTRIILTWPSLTCHHLRFRCPQCKGVTLALKFHPMAGDACAACMDKLSVLGDIGPSDRSASKRDPELDFDDLNLPVDGSLGPDEAYARRTTKVENIASPAHA